MKIALIILIVLFAYFLIRIIFKIDGSLNSSVSMEFVKEKLKRYNIENVQCPECGLQSNNLNWFKFRTSNESWRHLAGREGFYAKCPDCNKVVKNITTAMN